MHKYTINPRKQKMVWIIHISGAFAFGICFAGAGGEFD